MDQTEPFYNLEKEISTWQQTMLLGALTPDDVEELTEHLRDETLELQNHGLSEQEAWMVARQRIGHPLAINNEFNKVNPDFAANRNLVMLFWGGIIFMILQTALFSYPTRLMTPLYNGPHKTWEKPLITLDQAVVLLNIFSVLTVGLIILVNIRATKISIWFNTLLIKYSIYISLILITTVTFVAMRNYGAISQSMRSIYRENRTLDFSIAVMGSIFYGALIFCTIWFTIRYRNQELRNFKIFSRHINWIMSLMIGTILEFITALTNANENPSLYLKIILIFILFGAAGWTITNSKRILLNFFMVHFTALCFCITTYFFTHHPFMAVIEYSSTWLALYTGYVINKLHTSRLKQLI
ncbi:hypothetical protein HQ865_10400 [Mucilaginibacter mali]|uniref:Uncharacterized protein n=1 Tax=Mucilaginibacter mali TaxID=2740462 RepID=A0A7D4TML7_9SPHI|nr:hypothetical protein [Mucilaginibacter mali]QKJ30153.1 hypothetical protein HQ865_10400 [Mucilaginibacter mali]